MGRQSKQVLKAVLDKKEKALQRQRKGKLADLRVSKRILARYRFAVGLILAFWLSNENGPSVDSNWDRAACEFIESMWAGGEPAYHANDALAGLQHFLPLKGHLICSWKLVKTWHKLEPPARVLPMHPLLLMGMAGLLWRAGQQDIAALILVGFDCFLRSGELYQLERRDLLFERDKVVVKLRETKYGQQIGHDQMVLCHSLLACAALNKVCKKLESHDKVLRSNPNTFRKHFAAAAKVFGFTERISVYSLRRGGATWSFLQSGSMELCLLRGRWQSSQTARIYLQDAVAGLSDLQLSDELRKRLQHHAMFLQGQLT